MFERDLNSLCWRFNGARLKAPKRCLFSAFTIALLFLQAGAIAQTQAVSTPSIPTAASAADTADKHDIQLDRFEDDIRKFESQDKLNPPSKGGTLFIGSSTFVRWPHLEKTFKAYQPVNRAFGGSTIPEINHYIDRIVVPYQPTRIVFYAGTNDIASGRTGRQVFDDFCSFERTVRNAIPDVDIYYVSMSVAPSRTQFQAQFDEGNSLIKKFADEKKHVIYIDVTPVMRTAQGRLHSNYFGPDALHMKSVGYSKWVPIIKRSLDSVEI